MGIKLVRLIRLRINRIIFNGADRRKISQKRTVSIIRKYVLSEYVLTEFLCTWFSIELEEIVFLCNKLRTRISDSILDTLVFIRNNQKKEKKLIHYQLYFINSYLVIFY